MFYLVSQGKNTEVVEEKNQGLDVPEEPAILGQAGRERGAPGAGSVEGTIGALSAGRRAGGTLAALAIPQRPRDCRTP